MKMNRNSSIEFNSYGALKSSLYESKVYIVKRTRKLTKVKCLNTQLVDT